LVDAGISKKRVVAALAVYGMSPADMDGILVTHEHSDHINGLGVMSRGYRLPIYGTRKTLDTIKRMSFLGRIDSDLFCEVYPDMDFYVKGFRIHPFSISHDAADPVAYRIEGERSVAVATDMGKYNDYIIKNLEGLDAILLEANHDVHMLQTGSYPYPLKRRILGDCGHLSNELSGKLLCEILHDKMKYVFLGHLSKENNREEIAYSTVLEKLQTSRKCVGTDIPITVARRDCPCAMVEF
jgi:phosphoribosyl 1,2-cyclic phosphodiesterase